MTEPLRVPQPPPPPVPERLPARRRFVDRAGATIVKAGGLAIIASLLAIFVFLLVEIWPLWRPARVRQDSRIEELAALALVTDEYRTHVALLTAQGTVRVVRAAGGEDVAVWPLAPGEPLEIEGAVVVPGGSWIGAWTARGDILAVPVRWEVAFEGSERVVRPVAPEPVRFVLRDTLAPLRAAAVQVRDQDGSAVAVVQRADGRLAVVRREVVENFLTGESTASWTEWLSPDPLPDRITALVVDREQRYVYAGTSSGRLLSWELDGAVLGDAMASPQGSPVTALTLLIGHRSLVVGREDGSLEIWFRQRGTGEGAPARLAKVREFPRHGDAIATLTPSLRDRTFFAADEAGLAGLYHSTSRRVLWRGPVSLLQPRSAFFAPKGDGLAVGGRDGVALLDVLNPHPEVGWRALFGKVWYEGYDGPEFVWQSSSGTDDFEPKLSLTPLIVGTLKGTLYSLLLAIPLAVFGAMYASQFMHASLKRYVKPTVEIMAALPSVVLGFFAGLWLAPRLERVFPGVLLAHLLLPAALVALGLGQRALPGRMRGRLRHGGEVVLYGAVLALGLWACLAASPWLEAWLFGGSFSDWLLETTGWRYDQRNAIVVGIAMGFAVIPIIFSVAEEAFSNVPQELVCASLALGATRWQTVTRMVLPAASPGIFSAVMIGFGRAVGETMIVLMATGNTPILDWSPFNGFRTLSANIAVEIPEAPYGSTLYRTLFVAALVLFVFTFAVNTAAEIVRQRLRERHGRL